MSTVPNRNLAMPLYDGAEESEPEISLDSEQSNPSDMGLN
jgi:hypothetical protein